MRFCLICVNYNSYESLTRLAHSLDVASKYFSGVSLSLVIVDNSTCDFDEAALSEIRSLLPNVCYMKSENVGYFPAANVAMDALADEVFSYDFIGVSNVDLEVDPGFFAELDQCEVPADVGVLAPSIMSLHRRSDLNPKMAVRPSKARLKRNLAIFKWPALFWLFGKLSDFKFRRAADQSDDLVTAFTRCIYAPHGSFMIFTRRYFSCGGHFRYPRFLFGEEVFVGEECALRQLWVLYAPTIKIRDEDHGSTSLQSRRFISKEHVKSLRYLINTYFSEKRP